MHRHFVVIRAPSCVLMFSHALGFPTKILNINLQQEDDLWPSHDKNANLNIYRHVHCLMWKDGIQGVAESIRVDETKGNWYTYQHKGHSPMKSYYNWPSSSAAWLFTVHDIIASLWNFYSQRAPFETETSSIFFFLQAGVRYITQAVFDIGNVTSLTAGSSDADHQIIIQYEIVYVSLANYQPNSLFWTGAGMEYDSGNLIWVSLLGFTLQESPLVNDWIGDFCQTYLKPVTVYCYLYHGYRHLV